MKYININLSFLTTLIGFLFVLFSAHPGVAMEKKRKREDNLLAPQLTKKRPTLNGKNSEAPSHVVERNREGTQKEDISYIFQFDKLPYLYIFMLLSDEDLIRLGSVSRGCRRLLAEQLNAKKGAVLWYDGPARRQMQTAGYPPISEIIHAAALKKGVNVFLSFRTKLSRLTGNGRIHHPTSYLFEFSKERKIISDLAVRVADNSIAQKFLNAVYEEMLSGEKKVQQFIQNKEAKIATNAAKFNNAAAYDFLGVVLWNENHVVENAVGYVAKAHQLTEARNHPQLLSQRAHFEMLNALYTKNKLGNYQELLAHPLTDLDKKIDIMDELSDLDLDCKTYDELAQLAISVSNELKRKCELQNCEDYEEDLEEEEYEYYSIEDNYPEFFAIHDIFIVHASLHSDANLQNLCATHGIKDERFFIAMYSVLLNFNRSAPDKRPSMKKDLLRLIKSFMQLLARYDDTDWKWETRSLSLFAQAYLEDQDKNLVVHDSDVLSLAVFKFYTDLLASPDSPGEDLQDFVNVYQRRRLVEAIEPQEFNCLLAAFHHKDFENLPLASMTMIYSRIFTLADKLGTKAF